MPSNQKKSDEQQAAFTMMPYRDGFVQTYKRAIKPAVEGCGLRSLIAKDDWKSGPIEGRIREQIDVASVCIADLTGNNSNVMYEVAVAHSCKKPVILITQEEPENVPFDVRNHRVIKYTATSEGRVDLLERLIVSIRATLGLSELPLRLLRKMLVPASLALRDGPYVVAASPLSFRAATGSRGGWKGPPSTLSDHVGIRGLMQSFGLLYGLNRLPELLNPDDFKDTVLDSTMHLYCIASSKSNRWTGKMMKRFFAARHPKWEFKPDPESTNLSNPWVLIRKNGKPCELDKKKKVIRRYGQPCEPELGAPPESDKSRIVVRRTKWDFGLVIRGPNPSDSRCLFMALAGRSSLGTVAASMAATVPEFIQVLDRELLQQGTDLDDHRTAFCAVVSIAASEKGYVYGVDRDSFEVNDLWVYPPDLREKSVE